MIFVNDFWQTSGGGEAPNKKSLVSALTYHPQTKTGRRGQLTEIAKLKEAEVDAELAGIEGMIEGLCLLLDRPGMSGHLSQWFHKLPRVWEDSVELGSF